MWEKSPQHEVVGQTEQIQTGACSAKVGMQPGLAQMRMLDCCSYMPFDLSVALFIRAQ